MDISDENLIEDYKDGNDEALKEIIFRYTHVLYNFVRRFSFTDEEAEDLLQTIFIKVWKQVHRFDSEQSSFKTWIFTVARNSIYDELRKKKRMVSLSSLDVTDDEGGYGEHEDQTKDIVTILEHEVTHTRLLDALESLSPQEKTIVLLHFEEDMTFKEIGDIFSTSSNTVKSKYRRALLKLRDILQDMHPNTLY